MIDGKMRRVKAKVERFDFSSHCGASQLQETVKTLDGSPKVFVMHGAEGNCERFTRWVREEVGLESIAPKSGETYEV